MLKLGNLGSTPEEIFEMRPVGQKDQFNLSFSFPFIIGRHPVISPLIIDSKAGEINFSLK